MAITQARSDINNYSIPRGIVQWDPYVGGEYEGQIDMGETENASLTIKTETFEAYSARTGLRVKAISANVGMDATV